MFAHNRTGDADIAATSAPAASRFFELVAQDARHALRALRATPGFTLTALLCLAVGIGANATMFGVADRLFLEPPAGIHDPGSVVRVYFDRATGGVRTPGGGGGSYPDFTDLRTRATSGARAAFQSIAAYSKETFDYGVGADVRRLEGQAVTAQYFDVLHTRPALGRFFLPEEDSIAFSHPVAVVSYSFWQREFGGDPGAIGRVIKIDGRDFTIIGVAERGFSGFDLQPLDVWIPLHELPAGPGPSAFTERHAIWLPLVARLASGVSPSTAAARATTVKRQIDPVMAPDLDPRVRVLTGPLLEANGPQRNSQASIALWLVGAVAFVLLIACANVANLLLARGTRRRREIAVRQSLGARRSQLVRPLLAESLMLAILGGALGLVLSAWTAGIMTFFSLPPGTALIDLRVVAFTAVLSVITALIAGVMPAVLSTRGDLTSALKDGTLKTGRGQSSVQAVLLVVQATLSIVVLAGAALFVRSLRNVHAIDLGVDSDHLVLATLDLQGSTYDSTARKELTRRVVDRLSTLPGVRAVSYEGLAPFQGVMGLRAQLPGQDSSTSDRRPMFANFVGPDYLRAAGTPLLRGRDIAETDRANTQPVIVVNETMAARLWPGRDPIGQCLQISVGPPRSGAPATCFYVVGVMGNGKYISVTEDPAAYYVMPFSRLPMGLPPTLLIRTSGDPHRLLSDVRTTITSVAPNLPNLDIRLLSDAIDPLLQPYRIGAVLFTVFGVLALGLAAIGLYGVVAYVVAQRTREAGVRIALGAPEGAVVRVMGGQGMRPALIGIVLGVGMALVLTHLIASQLYGVSPSDPGTYVVVALVLSAVAALACYLPARRAARVDPVIALRSE
jgi:putative ABC transport system permease protein